MIQGMYPIQHAARSEFIPIRHLSYHVLQWGTPSDDKTPLVMLHGWMDVAASFQFVVDALQHGHWVIAPDWRGFGLTHTPDTDNFWFPDYLADLDHLLDHYVGNRPVNLLGHSMGGHVATLYAGVRPERIHRLINLEGFGLPATRPAQAPSRLAKWMDELKALHRGEMDLKPYPDLEAVAQRLIKTNPRLGADKAHWLAQHWASANAQGEWRILGHAAHKVGTRNFSNSMKPKPFTSVSPHPCCVWWPATTASGNGGRTAIPWRNSSNVSASCAISPMRRSMMQATCSTTTNPNSWPN